jgi:predicted enzyme related to lactoylglutathione lyase
MKNNPVGWFEIHVQDMARAQKYYETVLGVTLQKLNSEYDMLAFPMEMERYGAPGALIKMDGMDSGGNSVLVYFSCDDCAQEASRVVPAGGRIHKDKISIGEYGFIALVLDTEGNMFGLHSLK